MKRLIFLLLLLNTPLWANTPESCQNRADQLDSLFESGRYGHDDTERAINAINKANSSKIVLLGEVHYRKEVTEKYPLILENVVVSNPDIDCLALEIPDVQVERDAFDFFIENKYEKSSWGGLTLYGHLSKYVNTGKVSPLSKLPNSRWGELFYKAVDMGLKIIPIDHPKASTTSRSQKLQSVNKEDAQNFTDEQRKEFMSLSKETHEWATSLEGMNARDTYMHAKIKNLLSSGQCKGVVGLFGKAHLSSRKEGRHTLNQKMNKDFAPEEVLSLNLVYTGFIRLMGWGKKDYSMYWKWEDCASNPTPPESVQAIPGGLKALDEIPVFPLGGGKYSDFDYHIIFPMFD